MAEQSTVNNSTAVPVSGPNGDVILLRTESITKVFPGTVALDQVDYNIYKGKINALVGENGAGKSTLMKILVGNEQSTKGRVILEGEEIHVKVTSGCDALWDWHHLPGT
ncbi:unnamed protein product [marine sediment metagenome]|uniref:ABC transporter domain-containing protein n=1 Tax=marine sediment metagenome TaxID=412755 RepID=X1MK19_9ZZZZ